jgi:hypothetical protein
VSDYKPRAALEALRGFPPLQNCLDRLKFYGRSQTICAHVYGSGRVPALDAKVEFNAEKLLVLFAKPPEGFARIGSAEFANLDDIPDGPNTTFPNP